MLAIGLIAVVTCPRSGRAQAASVPATLAGTWVLDGDPARAARTIEAAFAPSIATLPELLQGFARDRIRSSMQPPRRVLVTIDGSRVRVTLESQRTTVVDGALGASARVTGVEDGTRVTPRLQGGWLELLYEGEGSVLQQLCSTEPDGARMHLDFTVVSARLPAPVRYRLDYVRPRS
ncbi:hypothetical protein [Sandaracinus amylolyticus]|uniref:DUF1579 domain-containing protein n=1 Tax=Sandaracinus amylolyticus TaxID=927083 RepID=A0A0F6W0F6_9BACT|nr:hypothetical protein [Sandaracinus amylolyticus]AKF04306.1 hypothetical protein DB32_001455 [Sandaracinus amylolyticus]